MIVVVILEACVKTFPAFNYNEVYWALGSVDAVADCNGLLVVTLIQMTVQIVLVDQQA